MNHYTITYFTSGGYKTTGRFDTDYDVRTDSGGHIGVWSEDQLLGDVTLLETLFLRQLGWSEDITVVRVDPGPASVIQPPEESESKAVVPKEMTPEPE